MTRRARITCVVGLLAAGWLAPSARAQGRIPNFPIGIALPDASGRNGLFWLGGDSPFGTPLGPDASFWAFGDTFLSPMGVGRELSGVVGNTIAIGRVADGKFAPSYFYRGTAASRQAFFPNPGPAHKYWPKASILLEGKLYVFLTLIYLKPGLALGDPAGSLDAGSIIARVNNPSAMPTTWQIDYLRYHVEDPYAQANLKLGIEILPSPGARALVVYGFFNNAKTGAAKAIATLVSYEGLRDTPPGGAVDPAQVQYLASGGDAGPAWKPGFGRFSTGPDDYLNTEIDCISGFTVRWNSALRLWQVVGASSQFAAMYPYPRTHPYTPRPTARIFTHASPFGPFLTSPGASSCEFYTFGELRSREPSLYCYTARQWQDPADPRYDTDAHLLLTYTYSTRDLAKAVADRSLYQNRAVLLRNPFSGPAGPRTPCPNPPRPAVDPAPPIAPADPFAAPDVPRPLPFPGRPTGEAIPPG